MPPNGQGIAALIAFGILDQLTGESLSENIKFSTKTDVTVPPAGILDLSVGTMEWVQAC